MRDLQIICNQITRLGYNAIFRYPEKESTIGSIWKGGENQSRLEAVVNDETLSFRCRFIAAEILFEKDLSFLAGAKNDTLAHIYLQAVLGNYTGQMSDWGFKNGTDDLGILGRRILIFGEASVNDWKRYLTDDQRIVYVDFLDQIYGNVDYRIKDLAALYIIHIRNTGFVLPGKKEDRDKTIEWLIESLR